MTRTTRYIADPVRSWWSRIPLGIGLQEPVWQLRHRRMLAILWLHVAGFGLYGSLGAHGWVASVVSCMAVAIPTLCASLSRLSPRGRSAFSAVAAFAASAALVHLSGGYIESHFHFFVMVAAMALYQDWLPFLVNIILVILHHGIMGIVSPAIVYNHPDASLHPWIWTSIHGVFLLAECAVLISTWRVSELTEAKLQLSEERVRLLSEVSPVGLFQTDAEGHCFYRNNRCREILKQAGEDESLRHGTGFAVLGAEALAVWDQAIHQGREIELECPIGNQGGEITWVHVETRLIRGRDGAITGYAGTIQDITARKESEDRIIRLVQRLELAASSAEIGVWDWDITTNDLLWDDRMFALYGVQREQFGGAYEAWLSAVHPDDQARCDAAIQQACRNEKPYDIEFRIRWPNGEIRTIKGAGLVIFDAESRPVRMTGVNYDITARKQAEEKLQVYASEL
ncbi:MAG: PAS domain-containing protein, partial [Nitrospira sp.]|nr:PAS domain-containing protein [Nitrospira sp.]